MAQRLITIGREYGSGGHIIAQKVAEHFGIKLYDKTILAEISKEGNFSQEVMEKFDEKPVSMGFVPMSVNGYNMSIQQEIAMRQFDFIRKKGMEERESFVILGRCADEILYDNENVVRVFVTADEEFKIERIMKNENLERKEAIVKMKKANKLRKTYHNYYCDSKWGDSRGYDLCINAAKVDYDSAAKVIIEYVLAAEK